MGTSVIATHCNTRQHTATHCHTLHYSAKCSMRASSANSQRRLKWRNSRGSWPSTRPTTMARHPSTVRVLRTLLYVSFMGLLRRSLLQVSIKAPLYWFLLNICKSFLKPTPPICHHHHREASLHCTTSSLDSFFGRLVSCVGLCSSRVVFVSS